jgi:hypothetical protein
MQKQLTIIAPQTKNLNSLYWDHMPLPPELEQKVREKYSLSSSTQIKAFLEREGDLTEVWKAEEEGSRSNYFVALNGQDVAWGLYYLDEVWKRLQTFIPPAPNKLCYWVGSYVPSTPKYWLVTEADNFNMLRFPNGDIASQRIRLFELDEEHLVLKPRDMYFDPNEHYQKTPAHWRDVGRVVEYHNRDLFVFSGVDLNDHPCIGQIHLEIKDGEIQGELLQPMKLERAGDFPELEMPNLIQLDSLEYDYLLVSSTSPETHQTGVFLWYKEKDATDWKLGNKAKPIQFNLPETYNLYGLRARLAGETVLISGWVSKNGFIHGQSEDLRLHFEGQNVWVEEIVVSQDSV